jgi:sigma-B regulation protein RsbU (phosphoserine phosphatase)
LYHSATQRLDALRGQGIVLGIVPEPYFEERSVQLAPHDVVLFYTDGITEAMNAERELFGEERLEAVLREHAQQTCSEIIAAIRTAVAEFVGEASQSDDMTVVAIKREPTNTAPGYVSGSVK